MNVNAGKCITEVLTKVCLGFAVKLYHQAYSSFDCLFDLALCANMRTGLIVVVNLWKKEY
jgi:hypothetical protein